METEKQIWQEYSDTEKVAYLSAVTSIATDGRAANAAEVALVRQLGQQMGVSAQQLTRIEQTASNPTTRALPEYLTTLRESDLKYALLADLMSYAKADGQFTPDEKNRVRHLAAYLDIEQAHFAALNRFTDDSFRFSDDLDESHRNSMKDELSQTGLSASTLQRMLAAVEPLLRGQLGAANQMKTAKKSTDEASAVREAAESFGTASDNAGDISGQASGGESSGRAGSVMARFSGRNGYQGIGSAFDGIFGSSQ